MVKKREIRPNPKNLPKLSGELLEEAQNFLKRLELRDQEVFEQLSLRDDFIYVLGMSEFIAKTLIQYPKQCLELINQGFLESEVLSLDPKEAVLETIIPGLNDAELKKRLRILRRTRMVMIAWRDLTGRSDIEETFVALSNLAEEIVMRTIEVVREGFR